MIHRTIRHLKTRPHHERRAVALLVAIGIVVVLFLLWVITFVSSLRAHSVPSASAQSSVVTQ